MDEVEGLGHADVRHRLVDDLLQLDRGDADVEGSAGHRPELAQGLARDHGGELHHQPGPDVQAAVGDDLVEGEVVEYLDQLGVGPREGRGVVGKQLGRGTAERLR